MVTLQRRTCLVRAKRGPHIFAVAQASGGRGRGWLKEGNRLGRYIKLESPLPQKINDKALFSGLFVSGLRKANG
jgi:hypothetical protein